MRHVRKSVALRPSGRLLESRSDSGPRGMIAALRGYGVSVQIGVRAAWRTESGLQAHPLLSLLFSLHRPLYWGLVCENCAIGGRLFEAFSAFHDPTRALSEFLHVGGVV